MAHQVQQMAYTGQVPWHGLGNKLTEGQSLDVWCKEAGLNWEAQKAIVKYEHDGQIFRSNNRFVLKRSDTGSELGVVAKEYKTVQPKEVVHFFKEVIEKYNYSMESAGCLAEGKRIWALAKVGQSVALAANDIVENYLLLSTSYDKTLSTRAQFTSVRVVCQNTLSYARGKDGSGIIIPHHQNFNQVEVYKELGISTWSEFSDNIKEMSKFKISDEQAKNFIIEVVKGKELKGIDEKEEKRILSSSNFKKVFNLYKGNGIGSNLQSANGTLWGLVNAVTEYYDHHAGKSNDTRMNSAWFGKFARVKEDSYEKAVEILKAA